MNLVNGKNTDLPDLKCVTTDNSRYYVTPEGKHYPSVTTVVNWDKREFFAEWRKNNPGKSRAILSRGTKVHKLCEDYLNNELSFDDYTPDNVVMFKSIQSILDEIELVYGQERTLFSNHLRVGGRVDCVGVFRGKKHIIDFKTSSKPKKEEWIDNYFMQGSAYSVMWEEMTGVSIPYIAIIIAVADEVPQIFIEHRDNWIDKFIEIRNNYDNS